MSSGRLCHFPFKPLRCLCGLQTLIFSVLPAIIYTKCYALFLYFIQHILNVFYYLYCFFHIQKSVFICFNIWIFKSSNSHPFPNSSILINFNISFFGFFIKKSSIIISNLSRFFSFVWIKFKAKLFVF
ncbi:MAG: hypothetical protein PWP46_2020 [Fusobacteriaceae bacterium]|nr:hypothetical protein [Fusobacteriaceae bacterium]